MKKYGKVGVLFGGHSAEREVSLMSGTGVLEALRKEGVDAHPFDTGQRDFVELIREKFDRVFITLHGRYGEDGTIQGALEQLHIPYTGSGVLASALAMDKIASKNIWQAKKLPTPRFMILDAQSNWHDVASELGLPLIVKPASEGSTIGLTKVMAVAQLEEAYRKAAKLDNVVMAEEFIDGAELTCAILENTDGEAVALPVIRVLAPDGNYDYRHKYISDDTRYLCPAQLEDKVEHQVRALSLAAFHALGCRGWGRVDVMQRQADGSLHLLEVNTIPGMTSHSLVPMAAKVEGLTYGALALKILASARLSLHANEHWRPEV